MNTVGGSYELDMPVIDDPGEPDMDALLQRLSGQIMQHEEINSDANAIANGYYVEMAAYNHASLPNEAATKLPKRKYSKRITTKKSKPTKTKNKSAESRGPRRDPVSVENIVIVSPDAVLYETTGLYHEELGSINIKDIKGVYKNCRGIWAAQWTDTVGQRHTKYFNPKYFSSEESARVNAFKFKLDVTLQMERTKAGTDKLPSVSGGSQTPGGTYPVLANGSSYLYNGNSTSNQGGYPQFGRYPTNTSYEAQVYGSAPSNQSDLFDPTYGATNDTRMYESNNNWSGSKEYSQHMFTDEAMAIPVEPPKMNGLIPESLMRNHPQNADSQRAFRVKEPITLEQVQIITYACLISSTLGFCPCQTCASEMLPHNIKPEMASQILKWAIDARMTNATATLASIPAGLQFESQSRVPVVEHNLNPVPPMTMSDMNGVWQSGQTNEMAHMDYAKPSQNSTVQNDSTVTGIDRFRKLGSLIGDAMGFGAMVQNNHATAEHEIKWEQRTSTPMSHPDVKIDLYHSHPTTACSTPTG